MKPIMDKADRKITDNTIPTAGKLRRLISRIVAIIKSPSNMSCWVSVLINSGIAPVRWGWPPKWNSYWF